MQIVFIKKLYFKIYHDNFLGMMRAGAQNPPAPAKVDQFGRTRGKLVEALARVKARQRSSRSSSGSSASSSSDSDSSDSSSSSSRDNSPPRRTSGTVLANNYLNY